MKREKLPKTGEIFLMRPPTLFETPQEAQASFQAWHELAETVEHCGGSVVMMKPRTDGYRDSTFTRDTGIVLHTNEGWSFFAYPETEEGGLHQKEINDVRKILKHTNVEEKIGLPGYFQGGNVVHDPKRNITFWGVTNYDALREASEPGFNGNPIDVRLDLAKDTGDALRYAYQAFSQHPALAVDGKPHRVIPMFIPDSHAEQFYHLDGVFNVLPTGQAVICRSLLSKTAWSAAEKTIGSKDMILIDQDEAEKGATNFITVGSTIITPYASEKTAQKFRALGYEVIQPQDVGLPQGAWMFADMGAVRCATLKLTEDKGFPVQQQHAGVAVAIKKAAR
jgi:N-dimethylarginine dimethylaminohydrolase